MVYYRWGRIGVRGQDKLQGPYTSRDNAIQEFEQKFLSKTKNQWSNRKQFVCHPNSYTWLEMDYSQKDEELTVSCDTKFSVFLLPIINWCVQWLHLMKMYFQKVINLMPSRVN